MFTRVITIILFYSLKKVVEFSLGADDLAIQGFLSMFWLFILLALEFTRKFSVYRIFYFTVSLFLYSRIILQCIGYREFDNMSLFVHYDVNLINLITTLRLLDWTMFLLAI